MAINIGIWIVLGCLLYLSIIIIIHLIKKEGEMFGVGDKVKIARAYEGYTRNLNNTGKITHIHKGFAFVKLDKPYPDQPWRNEPIISLEHLDMIGGSNV